MEVHDHKKTTSSEHENHGVHLCNKCGWPFPNPHPSAKHRRSHKRVCGTIEGYKLIDSESDHANLAVSDDEQLSDEDQRTPSPKVDKGSIKEPGNSAETGSKSHISEDELFSDAVTEFSDTGVSPSLEERLQSVKQLDKNVGEELLHDLDERRVSKDEKTADTTQPQHILTQLPQGPGKASEISDSDIVGSERKQSEITKSTSDIRSENVSVGVNSTIGLEFDSSRVVSESIAVSDNSTVYSEYGKQKELISSGLRTDIEEKEKGDEGVDVPSTVASEVLQSEHKLEVEPKLEEVEGKTLGPVALEAMALETEKETSDPCIEPEFQSKLNKVNGKTSRAGIVDEIVDQEKELTNESQSKHDVSFQIEHPKFEDALVVYEVESDSAKNLTCSSHGQLDEVCDLKEGGNEDTHLLSVAKALPAVENPVVMIGDFKDYKVLKSSFPLDLWAAEEIRSAEDDEKVTVPENLPSALSSVPAGIADNSSSDASKDDLKKGGASTSISGEVDTSVPENLPNALLRVSAGTVDNTSSGALKYDLKKEGVSTANDGEVGTSVPLSLPNALSSVPDATVDNSSLDALKDGLKREGVSIPIDGEVGTSVPEDLPSVLSGVPPGTVDNSSSDVFVEDHKKDSVSTPIDGEVGISVPDNLPNALSSVPTGIVESSSSDALKYDLKKEGVSTSIDGEVGTSVSQSLPSALSCVPAGTVDKSSSDALEDDLKKRGVSTPIDGDVVTSVSEDLPSALSSVPTGTVDNSSSDVFREDLKKESVSTPIDGEVGTSIPENLPSALSSVPAGTVDNSSSDALKYDLKKGDVSTLIDGKVGTSIPRSLPNALSSGPAGTVDNSSSDALEDDLKKEGVSTPMDGEAGTFVPEDLPSALSSVPARIVDKSCSDVFREDLKKDSISTPIDGEVGTSVPENLPSALSSVPTGTVDNTSSDALKYDLEKEGVSTPIDGEVGTSVSQSLPSALSSVPTGTLDNPSSDTLEYDLRKEGVSTRIDGEVGISVPEDLPSALSSVPAGTVDNSSSDALEDDLKKEGVSTPIDGEVGSSGFRVTSDEDTHLLSVADTLPAVENPDFMIGDFKDYKVLKSSFSFELGAAEEIRSVEADNKVTLTENLPSALSNVPAGSVDNSSSDALDDDLKKEGISIPIDGEVGASGFRGTNNGDMHLVSVAETSPAADNPEVMIGDFKDYKVLKSSLPVELGAAEEIRSAEDDKRVAVPENLPTALSNVPAGSLDNFSSDTLEDELKKEGVSIPIDGEIGATVFRGTSDADFGSSGSGDHPKATGFGANNQPNNNLEGSLPQSVDGKSLQNEDSEPTTREHFDVIPIGSSTGEQTWQTTNLYGGENAYNNGNNKLLSVPTENGNVQVGDELSENITTTVVHVEGVVENINNSISLAGDDSICHGNFRMGFSGITGNETVKVAAEEKLVKHTDATHESVQHLPNSDNLDEVSGSNSVHICARDWGKLYTSSESPKCSHNSCPNAFEGLKGDDTEVPRSSTAPGMVSELKYEDPTVPSEKTSENSSPKKTVALSMESELLNNSCASVEDMNARDATILGPLLEDGNAKVTKQNLSVSAVDNSVVSSSRAGSLEGNWGSVSVLSIQSDVTAVPGAEVPSSTDSQAAEKLDGDFKKSQVPATECLPDKSDVFEPPSFMTLVESVVGVDKNAAASEIQTAQRDEETKSEVLQAGWFPSLTNVVNESEGRKKNEEIIAKVTNWSTGKQHGPLKNLLSEAHAETKTKSPNTKQVPAVNPADETASKNNDTAVTNVSSILASESADTIKKEMEKEWNSPARYPIPIKKEKRKGKPYWVPFVCCTSVHQDF